MNKKILKLITDVIATRSAEVLDLIDLEWDKKQVNLKVNGKILSLI